ncbi:MAG: inositol monophosphatase [Bacteroidetes bacterium 4572_77]|nr:MAG: inositol monophosphatase [Bacteroidetes bacterium 4572_77]
MELQLLTQKIIKLSKEVGGFLKNEITEVNDQDVEEKGIHNLVTYVDKKAERMLVYALSDFLPEAGFIAEEGTSKKIGAVYNWIIDPLDGTTNYIHGVPLYCVSLALKMHDEIVLGVIYEPNLDECFYSWKNAPSYLNGKIIQVSETKKLDQSLLATGFPYYDYDRLKDYLVFFEYLMRYSRGIRRLGSAAMDLAYVACGRYDGFYEYGLNAWDVAAGVLIVKNAGGENFDFKGGDDFIFGEEIVSLK